MAMEQYLLMSGSQVLGQTAPADLKFTFWAAHYSTTYKKEIKLLSATGQVQVDGGAPHGCYGFQNLGNSVDGLGDILFMQWSCRGEKGSPALHVYRRLEHSRGFELIHGPQQPLRPHVLLLNEGT